MSNSTFEYELIEARFPSKCSECLEEIPQGEMCWWNIPDKTICHIECLDTSDEFKARSLIGKYPTKRLQKSLVDTKWFSKGLIHYIYDAPRNELIRAMMRKPSYFGRGRDNKPRLIMHYDGNVGVTKLTNMLKATPGTTDVPEKQVMTQQVDINEISTSVFNQLVKNKQLTKFIEDTIKSKQPNEVHVTLTTETGTKMIKSKTKLGIQHKQFEALLKLISLKLNVYMVGPAGSGKSKAAAEVARALKLEFFAESVSQQTPVSILKGYMDANGKYVYSNFRRAYEHGGLFLLDEIDAANPNVLTALNSAIAIDSGELCSFPDKMVKRHQLFVCIAAANTFGRGADRMYVGRNPLDAASLDRFVVLNWDYDEVLEEYLGSKVGCSTELVEYIRKCRKACNELGIRHIISPRAIMFGGKMEKTGFTTSEIHDQVLFKGLDVDSVDKIKSWVTSH